MLFTVVFTDRAENTFESIGNQILERWGANERNVFRKRTYEVIDKIGIFPYMFKSIDKNDKVRKGFVHRNCSVFYQVNNTTIEILFFWDNRQDPIL